MHWRRKWQPTPLFFPGESQGQRSLVGCRLWGYTESDATDRLSSSSSNILPVYFFITKKSNLMNFPLQRAWKIFPFQREHKEEVGVQLQDCARTRPLQSWLTLSRPHGLLSQARPSMGTSRPEHWSGLPFPSPGDPPDPGIEPSSLMSPALAGGFFTKSATCEAPWN